MPIECPVGCALVFPEFLNTCHDHIDEQDALEVAVRAIADVHELMCGLC